MIVAGIALTLGALLIGVFFLLKYRDSIFVDKTVPGPPARLAWTRRDVLLHVCAVLCCLGALVAPDLLGVSSRTYPYTATSIATHLVFFVPWLGFQIVIGISDRRRRKFEQASRKAIKDEEQ